MTQRPYTTLFLIESLDGKISTGDVDSLDVDKDFRRIGGVKEGLKQYYEIEKTTDRVSFNSGRVMAKVGANERNIYETERSDVDFVIVDNLPNLTINGCEYFAKRSKTFYLITTNNRHPAFGLVDKHPNIKILLYEAKIDFIDVFRKLRQEFGVVRMTVQTGGTLNAQLLREGLIDHVSIVVAPCLIGGNNTQSLIGGESLRTQEGLQKIKALRLTSCEKLENSYLRLEYDVINDTIVL